LKAIAWRSDRYRWIGEHMQLRASPGMLCLGIPGGAQQGSGERPGKRFRYGVIRSRALIAENIA
jgi:hypothetical protein